MSIKKQFCYDYPRPALTADCIILRRKKKKTEVLLIKRAYEPFRGDWAFPGGFVDEHETTEHAAERELYEETGIRLTNLKQLHTFSEPDRDPRGRTVTVVYYTYIDTDRKPNAGDDAAESAWFSVKSLPSLAFDHAKIMDFALRKLKL